MAETPWKIQKQGEYHFVLSLIIFLQLGRNGGEVRELRAERTRVWPLIEIFVNKNTTAWNSVHHLAWRPPTSQRICPRPFSSAIHPGQAIDSARNIDCASKNTHPAFDLITGRQALLHVFFAVIVLDHPVLELATFSGLQNLRVELRLAFLAALPEPMLIHLAVDPFHPAEAPILNQWRCAATGEHDPWVLRLKP